jgi:hypothetical protein
VNRYDPAWFTIPSPQYIMPTAALSAGGAAGSTSSEPIEAALAKLDPSAAARLEAETVAGLSPFKRRKKGGPSFGFFEHGIQIGALVYFPAILASLGYMGFLLVRGGYRWYAR